LVLEALRAADLAVLVAFLCSPKARYITGQTVHVSGGAAA